MPGVVRAAALLAVAALLPLPSRAQDVRLDGLLDLRLLHPADQRSNRDGGFGKTERGSGDRPVAVRLAADQLALRAVVGLTPELRLVGELRAAAQQRTAVDILDAFALWRPVSTTRSRWSVKAGAFFPPVSLENTGVGWTSTWTLTPSAINSWVGDELRVMGAEGTYEWRGERDRLEVSGAAFGKNEPAGVGIADHGWTFNSKPLGLLDRLRLPDDPATGRASYSNQFRQLDRSVGLYGSAAWDRDDLGRLSVLHYDNRADPAANDGDFAWRTRFWSVGLSTEVGGLVLLAQGMTGSTTIAPAPGFASTTNFYAGYLLAGWERGAWRAAVRYDGFGTAERHPGPPAVRGSERGRALTAAVTWSPIRRLSMVAEVLAVDSTRAQRTLSGARARAVEPQAQLALRATF